MHAATRPPVWRRPPKSSPPLAPRGAQLVKATSYACWGWPLAYRFPATPRRPQRVRWDVAVPRLAAG